MRVSLRSSHREGEEESAFVSMTDMTVGFLFIVMILLAFFATKLSSTDTVPKADYDLAVRERDIAWNEARKLESRLEALQEKNKWLRQEVQIFRDRLQSPLEKYLSQLAAERRKILERLRDELRIEFPDIMVEISAESDALRFQGEGLFKTGESILYERQKKIVDGIAEKLDEILPCYTLGPGSRWNDDCNSGAAIIEAVQIEGHTDSDGDDLSNMELSTRRANATFSEMVGFQPELTEHRNYRDQPVLSVAGYGEMRPVADNSTPEGKRTNRRIDLRIIMYTPAGSQEIEAIREKLRAGEKPPP